MLLNSITHRGAGVGQGQSVVPYNMAGVSQGVVVPYNPQRVVWAKGRVMLYPITHRGLV